MLLFAAEYLKPKWLRSEEDACEAEEEEEEEDVDVDDGAAGACCC